MGHSRTKLFQTSGGRETTLAPGPQDDNKITSQTKIFCSLNIEVFQKHFFSYKTFATTNAETSRRRTVLDRT